MPSARGGLATMVSPRCPRCIHYKVSEAALTADRRNGLIWINWGEFWEDFVQWLQTEHPEVHKLIVAMDYLQNTGWNSWPVDPPYPYNNWSVTGVCSHEVRLTEYNDTIRTAIPCPEGMVPVLPKFEPEEILDGLDVEGYCTFPYHLEPPPGTADMTPIDIIRTGREGHGFDGAKYVNMSALTREVLGAWAQAVTLTESASGILVRANNELGSDLLTAFEIPEGSRILAVNSLVTMDNRDTGEPGGTVWEAAVEVDRVVSSGGIVFLIIDAPSGTRLHRYIVPSPRFSW